MPSRVRLVAVVVLGALAVVPGPAPAAHAVCEQPTLRIEGAPPGVAAVRRGQEVTVVGTGFVECGGGAGGPIPSCSSPDPDAEPTAMTGVELELLSGLVSRRSVPLGVADADAATDQLGRISWTVEIPERQLQGPATLTAEGPGGFDVGVAVIVRSADG